MTRFNAPKVQRGMTPDYPGKDSEILILWLFQEIAWLDAGAFNCSGINFA